MGFRAEQYLAAFEQSGLKTNFDTSRLTRNENGVIYDPAPDRITDLAAPNYVELTDDVLDEVRFSSALDNIVPILMKDFPDSIREDNFDPIAFAFVGANSTVRYFPAVGIWEEVPPDIDVTPVKDRLGPEGNPERKLFWRAPYEDASGKGLVMTVEVPVYSGDEYRGAFQIDLSLEKLVAQIDLSKLTPTGFAFYVDNEGEVIESEARSLIAAEIDGGNADLAGTLDAMRRGEEGVDRVTIGGDEMFIGYSPVEGVGGSLGLAASVEEVTASAAAITAGIEDEGNSTLRVTLVAMLALFICGLIGATYLNRRVLVRPIAAMANATRNVAAGDLNTSLPATSKDELGMLAESFNQMTSDLRQRRDALQREVVERVAAQSELAALFASMTDFVVVLDRDGYYLRVPHTNAQPSLIPPEDLVGKYIEDVMPAQQAATFMVSVHEALEAQSTRTIEYPLEIGEKTYWFSAAVSPVSDHEVVVVARDITERVNARQELERLVEERTRELTTLLRISNDVASTLELGPLLDTIIAQVRGIADYTRCSVFLIEGDSIVIANSRAIANDVPVSLRIPLNVIGPIWARIGQGQPVIIEDMRADTELANCYRAAAGDLIDTAFRDIHSWMGVPLVVQDRIIGMLTLSHSQNGFFNERHAGLVTAIATQIAVAIENARLYEQAQQLAAVEERQRLARELHDSVSQALYGIALGARTARTLLDTDPARAMEPMDYVLQLADAGLAEMRALIFELRPESLESEGLVAALEKQIAATRARYGIEVTAQLPEEPDLGLAEKEVFYRVGQEALHNVVKHAHASRVEITLASDPDGVRLEVSDNGTGFDAAQSFPGHMGLVSITERAAGIGATVAVDSKPGSGTTVRLSLRNVAAGTDRPV